MNLWFRRLLSTTLVLLLLVGAFWYSSTLFAPTRTTGKPFVVDIPMGASASSIAEKLKAAGVIRSTLVFQGMARLMGHSNDMKAGEYHIQPGKGLLEIMEQLVAGDAVSQWVVIPEGKTTRQVGEILGERRLANVNEFHRAASRRVTLYGVKLPTRRPAHGFLMPDTYRFPKQADEREIVRTMVKNWETKVYLPNKARIAASPYPLDKLLTIAAMIEREAQVAEDRPLISSVVRNRLAKGMKLQIDATVLYALKRHKNVVTFADLKVKSPFNTYLHKGLPPGPICNPGKASFEAALKPAKTDYLYYVAQPDGSHTFTRTGQEHNAAVAKVRKLRAAVASGGAKSSTGSP